MKKLIVLILLATSIGFAKGQPPIKLWKILYERIVMAEGRVHKLERRIELLDKIIRKQTKKATLQAKAK